MNMIKPNCRIQFSPDDIDFLLSVLPSKDNSSEHIKKLLSDPESFDVILDDERIAETIINRPQNLKISLRFYFYILVRHTLRKSGIDDRETADYIAELLSTYTRGNRSQQLTSKDNFQIEYIVDIIAAMENADSKMQFYLQAFIGNYALFLSGLFPAHINYRNRFKAAPKIEYYEKLGTSYYKLASSNRLALKYDIDGIFLKLSSGFHNLRIALNDLSNRLLFLQTPNYL